MQSLIIYSSTYRGHTERIARSMAEEIGAVLLDLKKIGDFDFQTEQYELIGLSSGVYRESLAPKLHKLLERMELRDKNVFVFSSSGMGLKLYHRALIKQLRSKGAIIKGSFACKGAYTAAEFTDRKIFDWLGRLAEGHPDDKDLQQAKAFITQLTRSLQ